MVDGEKMLISVIVPVYNTNPRFIEETLASTLLLKNLCTYEVIIVNDGSTDEATLKFLNQIDKTQFQIIHQQNKGLAGARNTGIAHAQGEYIFPLDSDDKIHADIGYFIQYIQNNKESDIIYGDFQIFGSKAKYSKGREFHPYELFFISNRVSACSIYKKEIWHKVGGYDESFRTCEDWDFWCACAVAKAKFKYLPYANFHYRVIKDGKSLYQKTQHLVYENHQRILAKYPLSILEPSEITMAMNAIVRHRVERKPGRSFAFLLYTISPKLYKILCPILNKLGLLKYKLEFFT